jgi:FkbM family methyltransferase
MSYAWYLASTQAADATVGGSWWCMGLGEQLERFIQDRRRRRVQADQGPHGSFHRAGGNDLLFQDMPVSSDDVVIDGGGYRGDWTAEMICRYGCRSIIFEPVPLFAAQLRARYGCNERVELCPAGLGRSSGTAALDVADNASRISAIRRPGSVDVPVRDIAEFIDSHNLTEIGCFKLNIEGGEYDVLERLIETGMLERVRCYVIQFHRVASDSEMRRSAIRQVLAKTYSSMFDFPFVWECWLRK